MKRLIVVGLAAFFALTSSAYAAGTLWNNNGWLWHDNQMPAPVLAGDLLTPANMDDAEVLPVPPDGCALDVGLSLGSVTYNGDDVSEVDICEDGYIIEDISTGEGGPKRPPMVPVNRSLPDPRFDGEAAFLPFFDDLQATPNSVVLLNTDYTCGSNNCTTIEWKNFALAARPTARVRFQVTFVDRSSGDGAVIFNYISITGTTGESATVGMQSADMDGLLTYTANSANTIMSGLVVAFADDPDNDGLNTVFEDADNDNTVDATESDPNDQDSDNDNVFDGGEVLAGTDFNDGGDPSTVTDSDMDGLSSLDENFFGTSDDDDDSDGDSAARIERVSITSVVNSTTYTVTINGNAYDITSDSDATGPEIRDALIADINGGSDATAIAFGARGLDVMAPVAGTDFMSFMVGANLSTTTWVSNSDWNDLAEVNAGSDPMIADSDGDGYNDGYEDGWGSDESDPTDWPEVNIPGSNEGKQLTAVRDSNGNFHVLKGEEDENLVYMMLDPRGGILIDDTDLADEIPFFGSSDEIQRLVAGITPTGAILFVASVDPSVNDCDFVFFGRIEPALDSQDGNAADPEVILTALSGMPDGGLGDCGANSAESWDGHPDLAVDAAGNAHITLENHEGTGPRDSGDMTQALYFRLNGTNGQILNQVVLGQAGRHDRMRPRVVTEGAGVAHVVWQEMNANPGEGTMYARFVNGVKVFGPQLIIKGWTERRAMVALGGSVFMLVGGNDIVYKNVDSDYVAAHGEAVPLHFGLISGGAYTSQVIDTRHSMGSTSTQLIRLSNGQFLGLWYDDNGLSDSFWATVNANGDLTSAPYISSSQDDPYEEGKAQWKTISEFGGVLSYLYSTSGELYLSQLPMTSLRPVTSGGRALRRIFDGKTYRIIGVGGGTSNGCVMSPEGSNGLSLALLALAVLGMFFNETRKRRNGNGSMIKNFVIMFAALAGVLFAGNAFAASGFVDGNSQLWIDNTDSGVSLDDADSIAVDMTGATELLVEPDGCDEDVDIGPSVTNPYTGSTDDYDICEDGYIVATEGGVVVPVNRGLPDIRFNSDEAILVYFDDLQQTVGSSILLLANYDCGAFTCGTIQWTNMALASNPDARLTFQLTLSSNGSIRFNYVSMMGTGADGSSATIGLQDDSADYWNLYSHNTASVSDGLAIMWDDDGDYDGIHDAFEDATRQVDRVHVDTVANSTTYTVTLNGTAFAITSDGSATVNEILNALANCINTPATLCNTIPTMAQPVTASNSFSTLFLESDSTGTAFTLAVSANLMTSSVTGNKAQVSDDTDRDTDDDEVFDGGEVLAGTDPDDDADPATVVDADDDGISALDETFFGSSDDAEDSDGDGLSDANELIGFDPPLNPASDDTDGDGFTDNLDANNDSDAQNPNDIPYIEYDLDDTWGGDETDDAGMLSHVRDSKGNFHIVYCEDDGDGPAYMMLSPTGEVLIAPTSLIQVTAGLFFDDDSYADSQRILVALLPGDELLFAVGHDNGDGSGVDDEEAGRISYGRMNPNLVPKTGGSVDPHTLVVWSRLLEPVHGNDSTDMHFDIAADVAGNGHLVYETRGGAQLGASSSCSCGPVTETYVRFDGKTGKVLNSDSFYTSPRHRIIRGRVTTQGTSAYIVYKQGFDGVYFTRYDNGVLGLPPVRLMNGFRETVEIAFQRGRLFFVGTGGETADPSYAIGGASRTSMLFGEINPMNGDFKAYPIDDRPPEATDYTTRTEIAPMSDGKLLISWYDDVVDQPIWAIVDTQGNLISRPYYRDADEQANADKGYFHTISEWNGVLASLNSIDSENSISLSLIPASRLLPTGITAIVGGAPGTTSEGCTINPTAEKSGSSVALLILAVALAMGWERRRRARG
ncbi:MAG: hypothetical protein KDH09_17660 [Chrysiogenetes bacterium]|nr:hypothetical protein [Chrysiogenetes bacterium]